MSGLVFACIAPHGSMIVPVLNEEGAEKALTTRASMEELGRRMAAARPETIVLVTPHGHRVDRAFSLLNNERVLGEPGPEHNEMGNGYSLIFEVDKDLNAAIIDTARSLEVPVSRIGYGVADDPAFNQPLDWGASVPLWFLGGMFRHPGWSSPALIEAICPGNYFRPSAELFGWPPSPSSGELPLLPAPTWATRTMRRAHMVTTRLRRNTMLRLSKR